MLSGRCALLAALLANTRSAIAAASATTMHVSGCQMFVTFNISQNEAAIIRCINQAAALGAEYMVTPEVQHGPQLS